MPYKALDRIYTTTGQPEEKSKRLMPEVDQLVEYIIFIVARLTELGRR